MDWISLLATGDLTTIIIVAVLVIVSGGVGAAIVNGITASKRGIRGDALIKEQNGIEGMGKLTEAQGAYIETLEDRIEKIGAESAQREGRLSARVDALEQRLEAEMAYSNLLISTLSENTIPIPPRPRKNN